MGLAIALVILGTESAPVFTLASEVAKEKTSAEVQMSQGTMPTDEETESTTSETTTSSDTNSSSTENTESATENDEENTSATESSTNETEDSNSSNTEDSETSATTDSSSSVETPTTDSSSSVEEPKPETPKPVAPQAPTSPSSSVEQPVVSQPAQAPDTLGSATIELDEALKVDDLTKSNLKGYELPLLNAFEDENRAVVLAEAIKGIEKTHEEFQVEATDFNSATFIDGLYQRLFDVSLGKTSAEQANAGSRIKFEEAQPGEVLFWEENGTIQKNGIYLGQGKYITVAPEAKDETKQTVQLFDFYETGATEKPGLPTFATNVMTDLKRTDYGENVLKTYSASFDFKRNEQTESFIQQIGEEARELGKDYDVFASVMIAQAILESGSGSSQLAGIPNYNLFGIKGNFNGNSVTFDTNEENSAGQSYTISASFRKYASYKDSLMDYVQLLRQGIRGNDNFYKPAWRSEAKNYLQTTSFLTGKYATDTQYNNKLNSLIATYNLTRFDLPKSEAGMILASSSDIPDSYHSKLVYPVYDGVNYNQSGSYPVGQCTWYVYNRFRQLGKSVDEFMGNGGAWGAKAVSLGYKTSQIPEVGTAISFQPGVAGADGQYGHVAFVEAVTADGILISESNVINDRTISYRVLPNEVAYGSGVTYISGK